MRALVVVAIMSSIAGASPPFDDGDFVFDKPRRTPPPFERYCTAPGKWDAIKSCMAKRAPDLKVIADRKHAKIVAGPSGRHMFIEFKRGVWAYAQRLGDDKYEIVGDDKVVTLGDAARQGRVIELRHYFETANAYRLDRTLEKYALVCPLEAQYCTWHRIGCTVMSRGRAIETFIGSLAIDDKGNVSVEGDRTQTSTRCRQ